MTDEMKALIAEAMERAENDLGYVNSLPRWYRESANSKYIVEGASLLARLAGALEAAYDAGRRELAERFATQDATRRAAIEELIAWEDEIEAHVTSGIVSDADGADVRALSSHPDEGTVTTVDELDALEHRTYVQGHDGFGHVRHLDHWILTAGSGHPHGSGEIELPARVLFRPTSDGSGTA